MRPYSHYNLEACVTSLSQAIQAEKSGASRLEICSRLEAGGMTPEYNVVVDICHHIAIPVRIMIRHTEFDFEASEIILEKMISSIEQFKFLPIEGFVLGLLKNKVVDKEAMKKLLMHTQPLPVTFHKAIDQSTNLIEDVKWMDGVPGIDAILTSGGVSKVMDGIENIIRMKSLFHKDIMAAGKIKPDQIPGLHDILGLKWYHGSSIVGNLEIKN